MPFTPDEVRYMQAWRFGSNHCVVSDVPNPQGDFLMNEDSQAFYGGEYLVCETICPTVATLIRMLIDEHFATRIPSNGGPLVAVRKD